MTNPDLSGLIRAAENIEVPPGDLETVVQRGRSVQGRNRRLTAAGTAAAVVVAALGFTAVLDRDPAPVAVRVGAPEEATRGDSGITWERVDVRSGLGYTNNVTDSLYAVSTAPGRATPANKDKRLVWHSDDGVDWTAVAELGDLYLSDLAEVKRRMYGVGTGPASAAVNGRAVSDLVVGWSDDGGEVWERRSLGVDMPALAAKTSHLAVGQVRIVATDDAVLAAATLFGELDVPKVLPPGEEAPNGWAITDAGVDILGDGPMCPPGTSPNRPGDAGDRPAPNDERPTGRQYGASCFEEDGTHREVTAQEGRGVEAQYTWEQLGVDGDLLRAVRNRPILFRADGGSTDFERIEVQALDRTSGTAVVEGVGGEILLAGYEAVSPSKAHSRAPALVMVRSVDGRQWESVAAPDDLNYPTAVGRLGDRLAIVGQGHTGATVWTGTGDGPWASTSLAGMSGSGDRTSHVDLTSAAIGPLGIVAVAVVTPDLVAQRGGFEFAHDGHTLRILDDRWAAVVTDASGAEVARTPSLQDAGNDGELRYDHGSGTVTLVDPSSGAVRATFPGEEINAAMHSMGRERSGDDMSYRLLSSRDGKVWSDDDLGELVGSRIGSVFRVLITGERAVVAGSPPLTGDPRGEPAPQFALVGTPD